MGDSSTTTTDLDQTDEDILPPAPGHRAAAGDVRDMGCILENVRRLPYRRFGFCCAAPSLVCRQRSEEGRFNLVERSATA
jgi:hypothetical protein